MLEMFGKREEHLCFSLKWGKLKRDSASHVQSLLNVTYISCFMEFVTATNFYAIFVGNVGENM